ncbi:MAG TPA: sigma-70 family RNA polymerase sigma factor [Candidatus Treponema faecavium]|nr:sigma-70 family RNA polymerase sigma factor [Candidatus Treponema faecavium]
MKQTHTQTTADNSVLAAYLKEINRIPLLSRDEETSLAERAAAGDAEAKKRLVSANLRFVVNVAKKYQNQGLELSDLINEGNIGLLTAADRFDVSKGYHFISYAVWWIRQAIIKAICEQSRMIRLPLNRANELVQIERARRAVNGNKTEEEEIREVADMLEMEPQHVREMLSISREMVSLDAAARSAEQDGATLGEFIEDTRYTAPEQHAMMLSMKEEIQHVLSTLSPKEADVLRCRFGLNGGKAMSLSEIGSVFKLTKERIRQIEHAAITKLQQPSRLGRLEAYVA